jgi:hypothetical protein
MPFEVSLTMFGVLNAGETKLWLQPVLHSGIFHTGQLTAFGALEVQMVHVKSELAIGKSYVF